jgi:hypothetical protein
MLTMSCNYVAGRDNYSGWVSISCYNRVAGTIDPREGTVAAADTAADRQVVHIRVRNPAVESIECKC